MHIVRLMMTVKAFAGYYYPAHIIIIIIIILTLEIKIHYAQEMFLYIC